MDLSEALTVDVTVTAQHVEEARRAAQDAAEHAERLAASAVTDPTVTGVQLTAARADAELADQRAGHIARQAHQAAEARRLQALAALGARIEDAVTVAEDDGIAAIGAAVREVGQAVAHLRQVLKAHDTVVRGLQGEANRLGAEPVSSLGPMPTSAHVATDTVSVRHEQVSLQAIGQHADDAIACAVSGDLAAARALLVPVVRHATPSRKRRLFVAVTGNVFNFDAVLPAAIVGQVKRGELLELPADLAEQHLLGRVTQEQITAFAGPLLAQRRAAYRAELARPRAPHTHTEPGPAGLQRIGA